MASYSNQSSDIIDTASCTWMVDNFSGTNKLVWSPDLFTGNSKKIQFQLGIYPNSTMTYCEDDVLVYLWHAETENILNLEYDVSIMKLNGEKGYTKKFYWNYEKNHGHYRNATYFISNSKLKNEFVQNNKFTLRCNINLHASPVSPNKNGIMESTEADKDAVLQNYQALLVNGKHSDVVLRVGKKEIHAHKTILAAQSSVFSAMFEHRGTKEAQEGRVEIIDIGSDAFEELLRYIYSGTMPDLDKYALELFVAADKYQLDHLKSICENRLGNSLSVESVASVLQLADLHQAEGLKSKCVTFITANSAEVLASEGWKKLRKCRLELVSEMLENIIISVTSKK